MESVKGLKEKEVKAARDKYGTNNLTESKRTTFWEKYTEKFNDPIIIILIVALLLNVIFTILGKVDWFECLGIFISVMISTFVGAASEYKNDESFQKIQKEAQMRTCKIYRDGILKELDSGQVVKGDFILLQSGDMVPADGYVYDGKVMVDQSVLNGENKEVEKKPSIEGLTKNSTDFFDKSSLYRGAVICSGQCIMEVTKVGDETVYGKMNRETQAEVRQSPLQLKLEALAKKISFFGYIGAGFVTAFCMLQKILSVSGPSFGAAIGYFGDKVQVFSDLVNSVIMGITVIVVAVPEGLPLMIAIVCSLNMKKMMKSNVLVRKLIGIETAGSINILFSDKTGTITTGKLEAVSFTDGALETVKSFNSLSEELKKLLYISIKENSQTKYSGDKIIGGNSTEKALLRFVEDYRKKDFKTSKGREVLFSSDKKYSMAEIKGEVNATFIKGAPEKIFPKCTAFYNSNGQKVPLYNISQLKEKTEKMAKDSIRIIAIATSENFGADGIPDNLTLIGFIGIKDEIRAGVKASVMEMKRAGIQTVMITGDKKETAVAISKEAGILAEQKDIVLTSDEMKNMTDMELKKALPHIRVVARALPSDKSRLVRLAQEEGMVSGMTGDGVNDLAALRLADVGFAMGSGADIAKESGDIVILDDNFSSIKKAVLYGRTIYKSIKKFITFQMTINIAAVSVSVLGPIVGIDHPLGITQMLWVNLVMDTLAAMAFGGEAALSGYMLEKPRRRDEDIIDKNMWGAITVGAVFVSAMSLFMFISQDMYYAFRSSENDAVFYTGYFSYFVFSCIFNAFNTRTEEIDLTEHISLNKPFIFIIILIFTVQILMTYFGGAVIGTAGLSAKEWMIVTVMSMLVIPVDILRKLIIRKI